MFNVQRILHGFIVSAALFALSGMNSASFAVPVPAAPKDIKEPAKTTPAKAEKKPEVPQKTEKQPTVKQHATKTQPEPQQSPQTGKKATPAKEKKSRDFSFIKNGKEQQPQASEPKTATQDQIDAYRDLRNQAKLLYNSNKPAEALAIYKQIPDAQKSSEDWMILANISQDEGKTIDAVFFLKKAILADDRNYKAHYNLGNIYFYDNKINAALGEYRKALKINKNYAYAYYNRGCCYLKKKSWFNARYEFGLAIKANSDDPVFYYNLAYTYKMLKKPKKAQEALDIYNKLMAQ